MPKVPLPFTHHPQPAFAGSRCAPQAHDIMHVKRRRGHLELPAPLPGTTTFDCLLGFYLTLRRACMTSVAFGNFVWSVFM